MWLHIHHHRDPEDAVLAKAVNAKLVTIINAMGALTTQMMGLEAQVAQLRTGLEKRGPAAHETAGPNSAPMADKPRP
jgi:hypothetical protein